MSKGGTVLLLLAKDGDRWRVLAGDAGQVNLSENTDGEAVARRASGQFVYYETDKSSLSGSTRIEGAAITLKSLRALVSAIVATGRPVLVEETSSPAHNTSIALPPTEKLAVNPPSPEHPAKHPALRASLGLICLTGVVTGAWLYTRRLRRN